MYTLCVDAVLSFISPGRASSTEGKEITRNRQGGSIKRWFPSSPGTGPGKDFPEVKRSPGDRIEEQRIPVGREPGSQRFPVVEHPLVPPIQQLIPVPGPEPNQPGGGGGGGGGGEETV